MLAAVLTEIGRAGGIGEFRPELEDVPDLDPVAQDHGLPARRTRIAFPGVRDVDRDVRCEIPPDIDVPVVVSDTVRAGDKVWRAGHELVDHDHRVVRPDRRAVAWLHPRGTDLLDRGGA